MITLLKSILFKIHLLLWEYHNTQHKLEWLEIEVTKRCNLLCLHCGSSCSNKIDKATELTSEQIINICKEISKKYNVKKINVAITGGEPLIRDDIYYIIANITEMGFKVSVVTNGHFINNETIKLLYASGIRSISISIDGMEVNHNWLRQNKNSFEICKNALYLLKKNGLFYVEAITTVNKKE